MYEKPPTLPLQEVAEHFSKQLKKIKVFLCDADGVLTDGLIHWSGTEVGFTRTFHTQDGYGLKLLESVGIKVGIISGGASMGLIKRIETIGVTYSFLGNEDKVHAYESILKDSKAKESEVLYIGDELFDLPILKRVGFSAAPPHSSLEIQEAVDYVTFRQGGEACVREVIDLIRYAQKLDFKKKIFSTPLTTRKTAKKKNKKG